MPEFIPNHIPTELDAFTCGYLECAEWLACVMSDRPDMSLTDEERNRCRGFTKKAIASAKRECKDFQDSNAGLLFIYYEKLGFNESQAGHDFWLTRNRHGSGFWDRDYSDKARNILNALTDASRGYGGSECEYYRGYLHLT
jgi:hypothetical protein